MADINARADHIGDKQALSFFLAELADDLLESPEDWENADLETFLRAMSAWLQDSDGYFLARGEQPPRDPTWYLIAEIFLAARVYE
jgi:hypothetical protein